MRNLQHVLEHLHVLGVHVLFLSSGDSHELDRFHLDVIPSTLYALRTQDFRRKNCRSSSWT